MPTTYTARGNVTSDEGAGLDWNDDIMTDENDNVILFNNGIVYSSNTLFTPRNPI